MKRNSTSLVDEHLQSLQEIQEVGTDEFFYTRLRARMEGQESNGWNLPMRPVWVIGTLALLLVLNGFMLQSNFKSKKQSENSSSSIQKFAEAYDQDIVSY